MNAKHIDPFVESFVNVMPQIGLCNVEKKGIILKDNFISSPGVMIVLDIIGDIKGNVIYGTTVDNAKKIASIMMMGMPVNNFDELAQSAISELTNMLTANAATNLSSQNISINISTPTLIDGDFKSNSNLAKLISAELAIDNMDFQVSISLDHGYIN